MFHLEVQEKWSFLSMGLGRKNSSLQVAPGGKSNDTGRGQVLRKKEDKGSRIRMDFLLKTGELNVPVLYKMPLQ